ncbi:MAG: acyltransferase family protein [Limosilactobacillus oris]|jgi:fucose 4-O-acetylase-like acetyltransferase|uniref:acyltransferase family protein n=1 Tax=Limosilactobacillus oris TaxID=1632 RepID=UPI002431E9C3|nr:acyltransferase family protein [Limosilactobacillus oris]MCH3910240.1 acyltransferase family protein [Limosilactobacillus oris]MCH3939367.1 acyltransferase family protein [Limosilactobacillus oris]MCI1980707.1 acyltransferase family protein [Limosilactobacillus oris]MCI2043101.1 acyltransferase family protein [Limosilactobacillus oris]
MSSTTDRTKGKRLEWVDIAKGIAILLMIIGHEVKNPHIYALIFSFHMPLFFILSGYTSSRINNWSKFFYKQKKSFKKIWLLAILMVILLNIEYLIFTPNYSVQNFWYNVLQGTFWGSNIPVFGIIGVGVMWFMFVFFWSKLLFDMFQVLLSDIYSGMILFVLSGVSMIWCQNFAHFLPQALDIVPVAALFMWVGAFTRKKVNFNNLNNLDKLIFTFIVLFWFICFICKIYIELSVRHYPGLFIPVIEALGGTFAICLLSKWIPAGKVSELLQNVGKHTLAVLCIHHLDLYWVTWQNYIQSWPLAAVVRLVVDLLLLVLFIYIQHLFTKRKELA